MNCTNLQQFITTYPRKRRQNTRDVQTGKKSQDTGGIILGCSEFLFSCFVLIKKKKKKTKKTRKVYQYRAWKLIYIYITDIYIYNCYIYITKTTLVLSNTPNTNGFTYEKRNSCSNMKYKRNTSTHSEISYIGTSHMYGHVLNLPYVVQ